MIAISRRLRVGATASALAAGGCTPHPEHPHPETSTGGGEPVCMVESVGGTTGGELGTTGAEPLAGTYLWRMVPGTGVELNIDLGDGGWMGAAFESPGAPLDWDIHSHEGDDVILHDGGHDVSAFAELTAAKPDLYSFYWRNPGPGDATLCVELRLAGDAGIHPH